MNSVMQQTYKDLDGGGVKTSLLTPVSPYVLFYQAIPFKDVDVHFYCSLLTKFIFTKFP